jgi:hypothetical protein
VQVDAEARPQRTLGDGDCEPAAADVLRGSQQPLGGGAAEHLVQRGLAAQVE